MHAGECRRHSHAVQAGTCCSHEPLHLGRVRLDDRDAVGIRHFPSLEISVNILALEQESVTNTCRGHAKHGSDHTARQRRTGTRTSSNHIA